MDHDWKKIGETTLTFYGMMSASISHEFANVLAVINEKAGLLQDLCAMAEKGKPQDPARIKGLADSIHDQIKRANGIVKNMNRFAHSVDEPIKAIDLGQDVLLMTAISGRLATNRGITLKPNIPDVPVNMETMPFNLMTLFWHILDFTLNHADDNKTVELTVSDNQGSPTLKYAGLSGITSSMDDFPLEPAKILLQLLQVNCALESDPGAVVLTFPKKLAQDSDSV
jgi:signal transduction histidine kinase